MPYKTDTIPTHHGGSGQHLHRDIDVTREVQETTDTDIERTQDYQPVETF